MTARRIFVDTGAWFAAQVVGDDQHEVAARALRELLSLPIGLVATNHVVGVKPMPGNVDVTYSSCSGLG